MLCIAVLIHINIECSPELFLTLLERELSTNRIGNITTADAFSLKLGPTVSVTGLRMTVFDFRWGHLDVMTKLLMQTRWYLQHSLNLESDSLR